MHVDMKEVYVYQHERGTLQVCNLEILLGACPTFLVELKDLVTHWQPPILCIRDLYSSCINGDVTTCSTIRGSQTIAHSFNYCRDHRRKKKETTGSPRQLYWFSNLAGIYYLFVFLKIPQARPQRGREGKQRKKVLCDSLRFDFAELSVSNAMKMNRCKDAAASLIMNCCMIKKKKMKVIMPMFS